MIDVREIATDALRYWETRRLAYNAVLFVVTALAYLVVAPFSGALPDVAMLAMLVVLAILANVLYCAAYPIDLFVQLSEYREPWRRARGLLFGAGTLLAVLLALPAALVVFSGPMLGMD